MAPPVTRNFSRRSVKRRPMEQFLKWPPWTLIAARYAEPSQDTRATLVSLAKTFKTANWAIFKEAQRDLKAHSEAGRNVHSYSTESPSYFTVTDISTLIAVNFIALEGMESEVTESALRKLAEMLEDCSYLRIWKAAVNSLLTYQGDLGQTVRWKIAKQYALDVLEQRDVAASLFAGVEDELRGCGTAWEEVCDRIRRKIRALERFTAVYDAQPAGAYPDKVLEPVYGLELLDDMKQLRKGGLVRYPARDQHSTMTLTGIVSLSTLLAMIPLGFAWSLSSQSPGSTADTDFFLLIQNSIVTAVGIGVTLFPTLGWPDSRAKWWGQVFGVLGIFCAIVAVPMYVKLPIMWSALVAFAAMVVQMFMALQLAVGPDGEKGNLKRD